MSTPINFMTPEQCAQQFEMYAGCHKDPVAIHQLTFCAKFLRDNCIDSKVAFMEGHHAGYVAANNERSFRDAIYAEDAYQNYIKELKSK